MSAIDKLFPAKLNSSDLIISSSSKVYPFFYSCQNTSNIFNNETFYISKYSAK